MLETFFKPRLTELGKIKIGGKGAERTSRGGKTFRIPVKLDHFVITTMQRDGSGNLEPDTELMSQLAVDYGTKAHEGAREGDPGIIQVDRHLEVLRQLPIRLLSNDPEDVMQTAYVWYGGKTVGARSDGMTVTWFNDHTNGTRLREPKVEPWDAGMLELIDSRKAKLFKLHTVLNCVIAAKQARWGGVYKFRTTSVITGRQLYGSLTQLSQLTGGVLMGMPLVLVVRPVQVTPNGKATTVYVVHVELRGPDLQAIQGQALAQMKYLVENREAMQRSQRQYKALLVAPGEETTEEEIIDMGDEFHPEQPSKDDLPAPVEADPLLEGGNDVAIAPSEGAIAASEAATEEQWGAPATSDELMAFDEEVEALTKEIEQLMEPLGSRDERKALEAAQIAGDWREAPVEKLMALKHKAIELRDAKE